MLYRIYYNVTFILLNETAQRKPNTKLHNEKHKEVHNVLHNKIY